MAGRKDAADEKEAQRKAAALHTELGHAMRIVSNVHQGAMAARQLRRRALLPAPAPPKGTPPPGRWLALPAPPPAAAPPKAFGPQAAPKGFKAAPKGFPKDFVNTPPAFKGRPHQGRIDAAL